MGGGETPPSEGSTSGSETDLKQTTPTTGREEETTETQVGTGQLDLANGKIVISPTGYTQGGTTYTYTGAYTITGSLTCDTPLSFTNTSGSAVVYDVTLNNAHLLGETNCSAVTFKDGETTSPITLNLTNNGASEIRAWGGAAFQAFGNTTSININITDNGSLYLDPRDQSQGDTANRIYDSNITCTINDQTVDNSGAYKSGTYETSSDTDTIKGTITNSNAPYTISEGGTYEVEGGNYSGYVADIETKDPVYINVKGNITNGFSKSFYCYGEANVTIKGESKEDNSKYILNAGIGVGSKTVVTVENLQIDVSGNDNSYYGDIAYHPYGHVIFKDCELKGKKSDTASTTAITVSEVELKNTTISGFNSAVSANSIVADGCTFKNNGTVFQLNSGQSITLKGKTTFKDNTNDIYYYSGGFTLDDSFDGSVKVSASEQTLTDGNKLQITTAGTSEKMLSNVTTGVDGCVVGYAEDDNAKGYLYLWKHTHEYTKIDADDEGDSLIAECSDSECDSSIVLATLTATDSSFTSKSYDGVSVEKNSTYENYIDVYNKQYKERDADDSEYSTTAPTQPGEYTVLVKVEYWNGTVREEYTLKKDFEITNTIKPSEITDTVTITKGGTYNIESGTFKIPNNSYAISINTKNSEDKVILNVLGNIACSVDRGYANGFIGIQNAGEVEINAKDENKNYKIDGESYFGVHGIYVSSNTKVTLNGGEYHYFPEGVYAENNENQLTLNECTFDFSYSSGSGVVAKNVIVENCTFSGAPMRCFYIRENGCLTFKGAQNVIDTNVTFYFSDVCLYKGATITVKDGAQINDKDYKLKVELYPSLGDEDQRQITKDTSSGMMDKITSTQGYTAIYKDNAIYFWNHTHSWTYKTDGNVLTAKCESEDCEYNKAPLTTTLIADGGVYKNEAYTASVENKNDNVTVSSDGIKYYDKDGKTLESAPKDAGTYKAEVEITYDNTVKTLTKEFTIAKASQTAPTANDISTENESIKGKKDGSISGVNSSMEYRKDGEEKYKSITGDSITGSASGKYYVRYAGDKNHNASDDLEVEIKSGKSLSVTVPTEQIGYTLSVDHSSVDYNGSSKITFKLADGYSKTDNFEIKVNGNRINLDKDDTYTISDITENIVITVEGVADITKPVISGIEDGKTYTKTKTFTVDDANLSEVKVDDVVVQADKDGKYTLVPKSGSYEISASDTAGNTTSITVTVNYEEVKVPSVASKTYTGETLKADIKNSDLYTVTSNSGGIDANTYSVELTLKDSVNYKWAGSDSAAVTISFEITKAKAVVNVTSNTLTYNGEDQALVSGSTTGGTLYYQLGNGEWSTDVPVGNGAGTYVVNYKVDGGTNYNNTDVKSVEVVIGKADPKLSVSAVSDKTYGDKEFKLDVTKSGNGTLSYSSSNKGVVTVDSSGKVSIVGAGEATLTVGVKESDNYKSGSATVTVKVDKKGHSLVIDTLTYNKTYGDDSFSLGAISDGKISYTSSDSKVATVDKDGNVSIVGKGTAMITANVDGDSNYIGVSKRVDVVVSPKSISKATVTLGSALVYTGSEQTQEVKSVVVDGMTVDTYSVSGNKATDAGNHTLTVTGTGNFDGTVSVDYVVVPTKASQMKVNSDGKISYGKGTISVDGNVLNSKTDLVEMLIKDGSISSSELSSIYSGSELSISLKITDVSNDLDDSVKSSMNVSGFTLGNQFLDISLYKGEEKIHTTSGKVKITIDVPDELINKDSSVKRTYYVIRNHNGEVSSIEGTFNGKNQTFTFETDKFSAYALAYKDTTTKQSETKKDATNKSDSKKETKKDSKKSTNTGVQSNMGLYISLIMISMIGLVVLVRRKSEQ